MTAGSAPTFTFRPDEGYEVGAVSVDGETVPCRTPASYVFLPVTCDHTLAVSFRLVDGSNVLNVE
jgi:hypothetical protein